MKLILSFDLPLNFNQYIKYILCINRVDTRDRFLSIFDTLSYRSLYKVNASVISLALEEVVS